MGLEILTTDRADERSTGALHRAAVARGLHSGLVKLGGFARGSVAVLLGDRLELLIGLHDALAQGCRIAFVGAGEYTRGARWDNATRAACAAAADLVFTYRDREKDCCLECGRWREWIWSGVPSLDEIEPVNRRASEHGKVLVAVNEVTAYRDETAAIWAALEALQSCAHASLEISTPGGDSSDKALPGWARRYQLRRPFREALKEARLIVGNSSAAIFEAPLYGVPAVDIGTRQEGRARIPSVFHAEPDADSIVRAWRRACDHAGPWETPYRNPAGACKAILDAIERLMIESLSD